MSIICLNSAAYLHYKHSDTVVWTGDWSDYDKLGWVPLGWFHSRSMIQNHSDHELHPKNHKYLLVHFMQKKSQWFWTTDSNLYYSKWMPGPYKIFLLVITLITSLLSVSRDGDDSKKGWQKGYTKWVLISSNFLSKWYLIWHIHVQDWMQVLFIWIVLHIWQC